MTPYNCLSRVSTLTRVIDIANLSVCLQSVRPSVFPHCCPRDIWHVGADICPLRRAKFHIYRWGNVSPLGEKPIFDH